MNTVKLSQVEGLLPEKNTDSGVTSKLKFDDYYFNNGCNSAIDQCADRELTLDKDKIIHIIERTKWKCTIDAINGKVKPYPTDNEIADNICNSLEEIIIARKP